MASDMLQTSIFESLFSKLAALLFYLAFHFLVVDTLCFFYRLFQQRSQVDLFYDEDTFSEGVHGELVALLQLLSLPDLAGQ